MRRYIGAALLSLIAIAVLSVSGARAEAAGPQKTKLPNGLTVILKEDHSSPVVAFQMWVKVGSADEVDREAGIAHVFEHMLFKGTEKRKVGEIAREIDASGGYINAYTSYDHTVYHLVVASRFSMKGIDILSDAVQHSTFDPVELGRELEVVKEEIRMREDRPGSKLFKTAMASAFSTHPYRRPVIGSLETVSSLTRKQILKFFKKWYVPKNMTLVITGDFDAGEMAEAVSRSFEGFTAGLRLRMPRPSEPEQRKWRLNIIAQPVVEARLSMGFHIPKLKHPDTYSLDVLAIILGQGASSRLYRELKVRRELVHSISASAITPKDPGIFLINAVLDAENTAQSLELTAAEIKRLLTDGPSTDELSKAKLALESDFIYARETMEGQATQLGYYETLTGDLSFEGKYLAGIRSVTSGDIKRVLDKYFTIDNLTLSLLLPEEGKADIKGEALIASVTKGFSIGEEPPAEAEPTEEARGETKRIVLANGITLLLRERHGNPTVALYATFPGGVRHESMEKNGISKFTAALLTRGTRRWTREELSKEVDSRAASLFGFSGRNSIGVSGKFLSKDFDKAIELISEMILTPTFPDEEIEKLRKETLAAIKRDQDNLPGYTFKLLYRELYREHPYGMPLKGTKRSVSSFTRDDLVEFSGSRLTPQEMVISIVGDFEAAYAEEAIKEVFGDFKREAAPAPELADEERPAQIRRTGEIKDKAQTNIGIGFIGATVTGEDRYPLSILTEVLSGQGGRLFIELRDRLGLAYSVSAFSNPGVDPGLIGVYIGTAPEKKDGAVEKILEELRKVTIEGITTEELERAKSALIGGYEIGLQEVGSQASDMAVNELLGIGYDHHKEYPNKIKQVTEEEVLRVAEKYLTLESYTISIVGPGGE